MQLISCKNLIFLFISTKFCGITVLSEKCLTLSESELETVLKRILEGNPKLETNTTKADDLQMDKEQIKKIPSEPGSPLNINMTFYIEDINSISDVNMDYRVDYYYSQEWVAAEENCKFYRQSLIDRKMYLNTTNDTNKMILNKEHFVLFWMPDIILANSKQVQQQSDLIETSLLKIYLKRDKVRCHMEYIARFSAIVACPMDFHDAPVDTQQCSIQFRSFAFTKDEIVLNWAYNVTYNSELRLLEHDFEISQKSDIFKLFNGLYSRLTISIRFERKIANKMVGVYTPSILIVLITFCSFWLGINSTPERVTIGITAVLALVTQFCDVRQSLPATSYITEIDKWMIMCMLFVAAQLFQCTLVHYVYEHEKYKKKLRDKTLNVINHFKRTSRNSEDFVLNLKSLSNKITDSKLVKNHRNINTRKSSLNKNPKFQDNVKRANCLSFLYSLLSRLISVPVSSDNPEYLPMRIDAASRILFPLCFTIICMFYWPTMIFKLF